MFYFIIYILLGHFVHIFFFVKALVLYLENFQLFSGDTSVLEGECNVRKRDRKADARPVDTSHSGAHAQAASRTNQE